jgi:hypothetical protein
VKLDVGSDFADLFEVKDKLAKVGQLYSNVDDGALTLGYRRDTFVRETVIKSQQEGRGQGRRLPVQGEDSAQSSWSVSFDVVARGRRGRHRGPGAPACRRPSRTRAASQQQEWVAGAPLLIATWDPRSKIYRRSLVDLASHRFETASRPVPAGGGPALVHGCVRTGQPAHQLPVAGVRTELSAATLRRWRSCQARTRIRSATPSRARSCTRSPRAR